LIAKGLRLLTAKNAQYVLGNSLLSFEKEEFLALGMILALSVT
jgi:hypothetical protein